MLSQVAEAVREGRRSRSIHVLVALLLPIPFLLVAHQLYFWDVSPFVSSRWAVNDDRTYIEIFGYVQLAVAVALLLVHSFWRREGPVYAGWALAMTVIVLDDALRWHELGGEWLVRQGAMPHLLGLAPQDYGELATWGALGLPVLLVVWVTHRLSPLRAQQDSWRLAALTVLLMSFAVGVDMLLEMVQSVTGNTVVHLLMTFVEAGGEVAAMTAMLAYVVHITRRGTARTDTGPLPDAPLARRPVG